LVLDGLNFFDNNTFNSTINTIAQNRSNINGTKSILKAVPSETTSELFGLLAK
jgi:hypothetical protein